MAKRKKYIVTNNNTAESFYECKTDIARRIGIYQPDTITEWEKKAKKTGKFRKVFFDYEILFTTFQETKVNTGFRLKK